MNFPNGSVERFHLQCRRLRRHRFNPWVGKIPWRKKWQSTPVFLPGKSHGQWSLTVYSPKGGKYIAIEKYIANLPPGDFPNPRIKPVSTESPALQVESFH